MPLPSSPMQTGPSPTLRFERKLWEAGDATVVGIDEVGRGSWAGPVTVAAVVAPDKHMSGIRDSKMLTAEERVKADAPRHRLGARHRCGARVAFGVRRPRDDRGPAARREPCA